MTPWIAVVQSSHRSTVREVAWGQTTIKLGSGGSIGIPTEPLDYLPPGLCTKSWTSAPTARNMIARASAKRVAPGCDTQEQMRPERPKYDRYYARFRAPEPFDSVIQGRRASRLPLAVIFRAVGALIRVFALFMQSLPPVDERTQWILLMIV